VLKSRQGWNIAVICLLQWLFSRLLNPASSYMDACSTALPIARYITNPVPVISVAETNTVLFEFLSR
jgi:hypothetical protein